MVPVSFGLKTLKEAVDAAFDAYLKEYKDAIYCIGSVVIARARLKLLCR